MSNQPFIICRCEEVSMEMLENAIKNGAGNPQELKMATRAGMGMCQGRICRTALESLFPNKEIKFLHQPSALTVHQPIRPVALGQMATKEIRT